MKYFLYKNCIYICLILALICASVYQVSTYNNGFFTAVDEGYFLLKLREAYEMSAITGKSQWNLIAVHWFPYIDLTNKAYSNLATCILYWVSIIVYTFTSCIIYRRERFLFYLAVFFLVYFRNDFGLNYVPMQASVLGWALCAYMLFRYYENKHIKHFLLVICGFCLCLSCFIIITGAIALFPLFLVMIIKNAEKCKSRIASNILFFFGGYFLCLLYVHFIICPLNDIIDAMKDTANYISKSGHGYDGVSFFRSYIAFSCKLMHVVFYVTGVYYVSSLLNNRFASWAVYILAVAFYYFKSPIMGEATKSVLFVSLLAIPLLFSVKLTNLFKNISEEKLHYIFLFLFPIIAPLGTNMGVEARLHGYVVSWLFVFFLYENKQEYKKYKFLIVPLFLLMLIPVYRLFRDNWNYDDRFHFTHGSKNFSSVSLTEKQMNYFNRIYRIISKYNYKPNKSVLFTTMYDYSTLYALDAVNSTNFYHTENFHYFDKSKMISPDFVILCPYDSILIAKELHAMPWGWPQDFDSYNIGNPETMDESTNMLPDNIFENRKLYCRRLRCKN